MEGECHIHECVSIVVLIQLVNPCFPKALRGCKLKLLSLITMDFVKVGTAKDIGPRQKSMPVIVETSPWNQTTDTANAYRLVKWHYSFS